MAMNILVADTPPQTCRSELDAAGHRCRYVPDATTETLLDELHGYEVLVVRSTKVTGEVLAAAEGLRLVIRAGSGTNTIDIAAAGERGISVCNVPGRNAVAVAELAFGLLLAIDRQIPDAVADLRAGHWDKRRYAQARGIHGRRVGVLGLGAVGMAFAERAAAFGAEVLAVHNDDRDVSTLDRARAIGLSYVDGPLALARTCDVLSLHLPSNARTRGTVDAELLERMQPGAILLNTARGELVDEQALLAAMESKGIRAGLDVYQDEPSASSGAFDSPLATHPNVYGTHHIGASTEQAQQAIADEVPRIVADFAAGRLRHCVNPSVVAGNGFAAAPGGA